MDDMIKIGRNTIFDYSDLMKLVDTSKDIIFGDVFTMCENSKIPIHILCDIFRCKYIKELCNEAKVPSRNKEEDNLDYLDYIELYWWGTKNTYKKVREDGNMWTLHGIGKLGYVPEDVLDNSEFTEKEKSEYKQEAALEFIPIYKLVNHHVKVSNKLHITDYDIKPIDGRRDASVDFSPSITLIEFFTAIFYEISFFGSPEERDKQTNKLSGLVEGIKNKEIETYDAEESLKRIRKKFNLDNE